MAKSPSEQYRELTNTLATLIALIDELRGNVTDLQASRDKLSESLNDLHREGELTKHKLDDHLKRTEKWDNRFWALLLVLASGLIFAILKR